MGKNIKIRNDNDKTIFEMKLEDNTQNEKIKPGKVIFRFILLIVVIAGSLGIGYILHKIL